MSGYLLQRAVGLVLSLLIASLITFFIMHAVPGNPFDETQQPLPPAAKHNLLVKYGLDKPIYEQYVRYMWNALHLDFGIPYASPTETVTELIARIWQPTLQLGALVILVSYSLGLLFGILAATHPRSPFDYLMTLFTTIGLAIPGFIVAIGLVYLFSIRLHWLPTGGWGEPRQLVMPLLVYAFGTTAFVTRYTRTAMVQALSDDHIRTAHAKGLRAQTVVLRHALRNALIPIITVLGANIPNILTGTIFIETIFRIPGLGRFFVTSATNRDYPMIMALMLLVMVFWGVTYFLTDALTARLDPRIRLGQHA